MQSEVVDHLSEKLSYSYTCFDRSIIRGYIRHLFPIGGVVNYFKSIGITTLTKETLSIPTTELVRHIEQLAENNQIPIQWWPSVKCPNKKNGGKSEYVEKTYLANYNGFDDKVFTIIADMEKTTTIENSKRHSSKTLYKVKKQVKFYYIYFYDSELGGLCYLKICTYMPFEMEFYFNGHHYIAHNLRKEGIAYKMQGNCFTEVANVERLQELSRQLTGMKIQARCECWTDKFFKFNKGTYSKTDPKLRHEWYSSQIEVCTNLVFKDKTFGKDFFNKMILLFSMLAVPDVLTKIFSARPHQKNRKTKTTQRRYALDAVIKHWFRGNSIKMYNKTGTLIRIETTINHPAKLGGTGLKKSLPYLQSFYWRGLECNQRYLDYCKQIDFNSVSTQQLDDLKQSVENSNGKKVAAPDLRKERQLILLKELIRPRFVCAPFRLKELKHYLSTYFSKSNQIRYEIEKLQVRGLIEKIQSSNFYRVTLDGFSQIWSLIMTNTHFANPMLSRSYKNEFKKFTGSTLKFEQGFIDIRQGLKALFICLTEDFSC